MFEINLIAYVFEKKIIIKKNKTILFIYDLFFLLCKKLARPTLKQSYVIFRVFYWKSHVRIWWGQKTSCKF